MKNILKLPFISKNLWWPSHEWKITSIRPYFPIYLLNQTLISLRYWVLNFTHLFICPTHDPWIAFVYWNIWNPDLNKEFAIYPKIWFQNWFSAVNLQYNETINIPGNNVSDFSFIRMARKQILSSEYTKYNDINQSMKGKDLERRNLTWHIWRSWKRDHRHDTQMGMIMRYRIDSHILIYLITGPAPNDVLIT